MHRFRSCTLLTLFILIYGLSLRVAAATLNLNTTQPSAGDAVTASGISAANSWIAVKALDSGGNIMFFDTVKSDDAGAYTCSFKLPGAGDGTWKVVAGSGADVAAASFNLTSGSAGGGGGGGGCGPAAANQNPAPPTDNDHDPTVVDPSVGGTVNLANNASLQIPAGALSGSTEIRIEITEVKFPPPAPAGFMFNGKTYRFTVAGAEHYNFNKPVTISFTLNSAALSSQAQPRIYYYDPEKSQWANLGGKISGDTIAISVNHLTMFTVLVPGTEKLVFNDIDRHWARKAIEKMAAGGMVSGYPDGSFQPDRVITRAEFTVMLVKAFKLEASLGRVFTDTRTHWARDYIATAAAHGIINGCNPASFGPDDPITREQMAVMTVRAAKLDAASGTTAFIDQGQIAPWARAAVATAVKAGIMHGYPDHTFKPGGKATRAEAVTVILQSTGG